MRKFISESRKLEKSAFELRRRRLNWRLVAKGRIEKHFKEACDSAEKYSYPLPMTCHTHETTYNEQTVQITGAPNPTGVVENQKDTDTRPSKIEVEKGAALVASFGSNGNVAFIIYPYKSGRHSRNEDNIILHHHLSPDAVTEKLIKRCISLFFLYVRSSSIYGSYSSSFLDFFRINLMIAADIRNRNKLYRSAFIFLAEWSKIIGAGVAGYIVAIMTQGS
ncbi:hypothetical protein LG325_08645 [Marinobacter nauticus]